MFNYNRKKGLQHLLNNCFQTIPINGTAIIKDNNKNTITTTSSLKMPTISLQLYSQINTNNKTRVSNQVFRPISNGTKKQVMILVWPKPSLPYYLLSM